MSMSTTLAIKKSRWVGFLFQLVLIFPARFHWQNPKRSNKCGFVWSSNRFFCCWAKFQVKLSVFHTSSIFFAKAKQPTIHQQKPWKHPPVPSSKSVMCESPWKKEVLLEFSLPENWGFMIQFDGRAYFSKGFETWNGPTSFVTIFSSLTRWKKIRGVVFKGDQVMAVQQQRQGPNGFGVLVTKNLVLGVIQLYSQLILGGMKLDANLW